MSYTDVGPLIGQRVVMQPLALDHVPGLVAAAQHGRERYTFTLVPGDEAGMESYVRGLLAGPDVPFATTDAATGKVLGCSRFLNTEHWLWPDFPRPLPDATEVGGTWLALEAQRTGVNREAKRLMLTHAFEVWGVRRVCLRTDSRNERSRTAIAGLGAQLDGVIRAAKAAYDGEVRDDAVFSILAAEWPAVKERLSS